MHANNKRVKNYDLFISYSSKDRTFVHKLAQDLKAHQLQVWLDHWEVQPGDRLRHRINEGIARSNYLLVVLTPNSIDAPWVKVELDSAMIKELEAKKVVVIPIIYGNVDHESMPLDLKGKLYLDFNRLDDYETNIDRIVSLFPSDKKILPFEYEILYSHTDIDIRDIKGAEVIFTKLKRIKVLGEQLNFIHEEIYADGVVDSFEVSPGSVTSINRTLGKYEIITDFGRPLFKTEEMEQTLKCKFHQSFLNATEYWVGWHPDPMRACGFTIHFPEGRPYKSYGCKIRTGIYERDYKYQPQELIIDDRPCIGIEIVNPNLNDYCKIEWTW